MNNLLFIIALLLGTAISCHRQGSGEEASVTPGAWGHLRDLAMTTPSKMFLSHVKRNESYRICLADYMVERYPGIEQEIKAAVNIWGHYIGREIPIEILRANLPEPSPLEDEQATMNRYFPLCPKKVHLVMGEGYLSDDSVGVTLTSYEALVRGKKEEVRSFKRALLLRRPLDAGEEISPDKVQVIWKTLAQTLGKETSAPEILEMMKKRDKTVYMTEPKELLTLPTIVHEFGHIWGLCDQYALSSGTNCDGEFASLDETTHYILLHPEANMARSNQVARAYLADDDILGIRRLAERPEFTHDWPRLEEFSSIEIPVIARGPDIAVAKKMGTKMVGQKLRLEMRLITNVPVEIKLDLYDRGIKEWMDFGKITLGGAVNYTPYSIDVPTVDSYGGTYQFERATVKIRPVGSNQGEVVLEFQIKKENKQAPYSPMPIEIIEPE